MRSASLRFSSTGFRVDDCARCHSAKSASLRGLLSRRRWPRRLDGRTPASEPARRAMVESPPQVFASFQKLRERIVADLCHGVCREGVCSTISREVPGPPGRALGRHQYSRRHQTASGGDVGRGTAGRAAAAPGAFPRFPVRETHHAPGRLCRGRGRPARRAQCPKTQAAAWRDPGAAVRTPHVRLQPTLDTGSFCLARTGRTYHPWAVARGSLLRTLTRGTAETTILDSSPRLYGGLARPGAKRQGDAS
jgi:hypothetical protein